jgi:hypothetical protein
MVRMCEISVAKKVSEGKPGSRRKVGKPTFRSLEDAEDDLLDLKMKRGK